MIEKYLDIYYMQPDGIPSVQVVERRKLSGFSKTASFSTLMEDVKDFISKISPEEGVSYLLCSAVTDGSAWDDNKNHDWFPTKSLSNLEYDPVVGLDYGAYTFNEGHFFFDHKNKDPKNSYGNVAFSIFNPHMKRIELVVKVNTYKNDELRAAIESGDRMALSMGCKVPFDVCPVEMPNWDSLYQMHIDEILKKKKSGEFPHINVDQSQYSYELKKNMGKVLPDGRKFLLANLFPKFFDISWIRNARHADPAAIVLSKVASEKEEEKDKNDLDNKNAEISKEIDGEVITEGRKSIEEYYHNKLFPVLERAESNMPKETLNEIAKFPLEQILSTFMAAGMKIHPEEFQRIILVSNGHSELADKMDSSDEVFDYTTPNYMQKYDNMMSGCFSPKHINGDILNILSNFLDDRSYHTPHVHKRIIIIKKAIREEQPVIGGKSSGIAGMYGSIGAILAALYYSAKHHGNKQAGKFISELTKDPKKLLLLAGLPILVNAVNRGRDASPYNHNKYPVYKVGAMNIPLSARLIAPTAATYLWSGHILNKAREGKPLSTIESTVLQHPLATSLGATAMALPGVRKSIFNAISSILKTSSDHSSILEKIGIENMDTDCYYPLVGEKLLMDYCKSAGIDKVAIIKPIGDKYYLYSHDGKVLGKHNSIEEAKKQEAAINISKQKNANKKLDK